MSYSVSDSRFNISLPFDNESGSIVNDLAIVWLFLSENVHKINGCMIVIYCHYFQLIMP